MRFFTKKMRRPEWCLNNRFHLVIGYDSFDQVTPKLKLKMSKEIDHEWIPKN